MHAVLLRLQQYEDTYITHTYTQAEEYRAQHGTNGFSTEHIPHLKGTLFTCFTSTKVQILTQEHIPHLKGLSTRLHTTLSALEPLLQLFPGV